MDIYQSLHTNPAVSVSESLLRIQAVSQRTGLSRSKIYALVVDGQFPHPLKLGQRVSVWPASEIDSWIRTVIKARAGSGVKV